VLIRTCEIQSITSSTAEERTKGDARILEKER
jgi:hypothetical protein